MLLVLEGVSKSFRRGATTVPALVEVSFQLQAGGVAGIWGGSRAGKTTLLRIACGLERPDEGRVLYRGRDLAELGEPEASDHRRLETACVWSAPLVAPGHRVLDFVALPLFPDGCSRSRARARGLDALRLVEVEHCADGRLHELSDGERHRVALAQALVREPRLLLVDEPVACLGPIERVGVVELLNRIAGERGTAVLVAATHALDVVRTATTYTLSGGRLIAPQPRPAGPGGEVIRLPLAGSGRRADA